MHSLRGTVALILLLLGGPGRAETFTVAAAASLTNALEELAATWSKTAGHIVKLSFAASSTLATQIEAGGPAALFIAADARSMDYLEKRARLAPGTRVNLLGNQLVLVMPAAEARPVALAPGFDLAALLGTGRLATGDPAHVPVGLYAQQALTALGVWDFAERRLVRAASVRAALVLVERGEVPAGIVYATDALVTPGVRTVGVFPENSHSPIVYPMALVAENASPGSRAFHAYLQRAPATAVFARFGFSPPP